MDSIRVDKQGGMVGEGNGSKDGEPGNNIRNPQRTEGRVPSAGRHQGGWPRHPKKGATVGTETGDAGNGPSHGRTGRGRIGEERGGVPSMRGIAGIQGKGAESGRRKERGAAVSPNTAAPREEGCRTAGH